MTLLADMLEDRFCFFAAIFNELLQLSQDAEVLHQDLQADEDQDDAARELRLGLVLEAEQIADLQSRGGTDERRYADQTDRQRHIDVRQQRERDADGQRVDARGQRQHIFGR